MSHLCSKRITLSIKSLTVSQEYFAIVPLELIIVNKFTGNSFQSYAWKYQTKFPKKKNFIREKNTERFFLGL